MSPPLPSPLPARRHLRVEAREEKRGESAAVRCRAVVCAWRGERGGCWGRCCAPPRVFFWATATPLPLVSCLAPHAARGRVAVRPRSGGRCVGATVRPDGLWARGSSVRVGVARGEVCVGERAPVRVRGPLSAPRWRARTGWTRSSPLPLRGGPWLPPRGPRACPLGRPSLPAPAPPGWGSRRGKARELAAPRGCVPRRRAAGRRGVARRRAFPSRVADAARRSPRVPPPPFGGSGERRGVESQRVRRVPSARACGWRCRRRWWRRVGGRGGLVGDRRVPPSPVPSAGRGLPRLSSSPFVPAPPRVPAALLLLSTSSAAPGGAAPPGARRPVLSSARPLLPRPRATHPPGGAVGRGSGAGVVGPLAAVPAAPPGFPVGARGGSPPPLPRFFLPFSSSRPAGDRRAGPRHFSRGASEPGSARLRLSESRPQIRRGDPLNLSILVSGGKETNQDSLSNGE